MHKKNIFLKNKYLKQQKTIYKYIRKNNKKLGIKKYNLKKKI